MVTTKAKASTDIPFVDSVAVDEAVARIRELNERLIESSKSAGKFTLDAYETALQSLVDFEEKVATASQVDWVSAVTATHAKFVQDVSGAYIAAARELLQ